MKSAVLSLAVGAFVAATGPYAASARQNGIGAIWLHELNTKHPAMSLPGPSQRDLSTGSITHDPGRG
ncbi:MAG TPA: hypothetical protein VGC92_03770, partial [Phenylobacterium sp.]